MEFSPGGVRGTRVIGRAAARPGGPKAAVLGLDGLCLFSPPSRTHPSLILIFIIAKKHIKKLVALSGATLPLHVHKLPNGPSSPTTGPARPTGKLTDQCVQLLVRTATRRRGGRDPRCWPAASTTTSRRWTQPRGPAGSDAPSCVQGARFRVARGLLDPRLALLRGRTRLQSTTGGYHLLP
jgi:hypothetical protein